MVVTLAGRTIDFRVKQFQSGSWFFTETNALFSPIAF
jgi:hypothetical protein